jgi:uncharacterized Zn-binding protein involved in type VI secretion
VDDGVEGSSNDNTPTFTWDSVTDTSGVDGYWCAVDDDTPESGGTWTTTLSSTTAPLTDGTHTFYVKAQNGSGLIGPYGSHGCVIDTTSPAAITDLAGQHETGDVILSWSTPGDDDWSNTLPAGSGYRIDYSSVTKSWDKDDFEVWIPTNGVAPHTEVSHTITGLQEGTTWYFQIWTRDEVPNWSGLSNGATVWIPTPSQTYIWDEGGAYGDWDDPLNWNLDQGYPNAATDKAVINTGSESINTGEVLTIGELELGSSYSGTLTLGGALTLDDSGPWDANLTISNANATLYLAGNNLTLEASSTFSNNGTLKLQGGETLTDLTNDTDSGTVEYVGDGDTAGDIYNLLDSGTTDYYHLTINSTDGATDTFRPDTTNLTVAGNFTLSTGTFTTNDGTTDRNLSVTGNVDIDCTFTANGSTISVGGNWDSSGGTFNYNTSTVDLTGEGNLKAAVLSPYFYNLTCAATTKTTTMQSDIYILNTLTLGSGTLFDGDGSSYTVALFKSSGTPLINGGATVTLNVINYYVTNGTITVTGGNYGVNYLMLQGASSNVTYNLGDNITVNGIFYPLAVNGATNVVCNTQNNTITTGYLVFGSDTSNGSTTLNCGTSTIDIGTGALGVLDAGGSHTLNLDSATVTCAGDWQLVTGTGTITQIPGTSTVTFDSNDTGKTITSNSQSFASVVFNSGDGTGGWTLQDNFTCSSVQIVDGVLNDGDKTVTINGNIDIADVGSQTLNSTGTWIQGANGNISNPYDWTNAFKVLQIADGVTSTRTGTTRTRKLVLGTSATLQGSSSVVLQFPTVNDFIDMGSGSNITGGAVSIIPHWDGLTKTQKAISVSAAVNIYWQNNADIQMTGNWTTGNLLIFGSLDSDTEAEATLLDTNGYNLTVNGSLTLGRNTGTGYHGKIIFSTGTHSITGNVSVNNNAGTHGYFDLGSADISIEGNCNFNYATVTPGTSTVTFDNATSTSTLTGSTTFYGLVSTASGKNVKVSSDTVIGVTGHLNFENITLRSTLNGATWYLNLSGTQDVSNVDVRDSNASGSTDTIIAFTSTDSGNNTKWDFGPPEAITDLTGECDSQTGDVTLSWSTPGDDYNWQNTLVDGSKYRIDYSSYSIQWSTNTYDVDISTSGVAPHTQVSRTITGLTADTTWYFQIWTRDEVPLWSGLSNGATVWVSVIVATVTVSAYTDGTPDVPPIYTQSTDNCLGTFKFEGTGTISELTITEYGTCDADGELEEVELYEDNGDGDWDSGDDIDQLGSTVNFNSSDKATFSFSLAASTYCYVHVILDVQSTADSGGTVGIELYQDDIVCTSTTTASSWPVQLETSMIIGESTPPSFDNFRSQNSTDVWITTSEWNDVLTPNTKVRIQDTGAGLRIGSQEVSPDTHTVLLLHLNNNTTDYSGHGNHGTREGGVDWISTDTWKTAGDKELILYFDGDGDYVNVSGLDWTPTIFSVVWWHYPLTRTDWNQQIKATNGWDEFVFHTTANGSVYVGTDMGNRFTPTDLPANTVELNKWQRFVYTYDGTQGRFYKNGVLLAGPKNQNSPGAWGGFQIGYDNIQTINGLIDEVRVLDRALTPNEIAADYYSGLFKYSKDGGSTWYSISGSTVAWSTGTVTGENESTSYETIYASNVPFNQYSETENQIKFLISDTNGNIAYSFPYIVMIGSITVSAYTDGTPDVPPIYTQSTDNCLGTFKFYRTGTITGLTITEYGTCDADGELENVELFKDDGDGDWESGQDTTLLGSTTNFNTSDKATFSGFSLAASTYCYVHVILDVKSTADSGDTVGIELYQNDIVCTSTTTASSWPVQLGTSIIGGETTPPSFDNSSFRSQNSTDVWITTSEWNDDLTPNTKVDVADTGTGLRIGSSEVSPDTHTVLLMHLNNDTTDYSGHGNHGTRQGGVDWISTDTWKTGGDTENILYFDGQDDYVDVGLFSNMIPDLTQDVSSAFWIKTAAASNGFHIPIGFTRTGGNTIYQVAIERNSSNKVEFYIRDEGLSLIWVSISTAINDNEWHHIVVVKSGNSAYDLKIYLDGVSQELTIESDGSFSNPNTNEDLYIGARNARGTDDNHLDGLIDEVRILDRVLTADEIAADYYSGLFKYSKDAGVTWYSISGSTVAWSTGTVTGVNGSTSYETIHASNVPFNQYSGTQNKIKFLVNDMQGNIAVSSEYIVKIGSITVSAYTDGTPDVPPTYVYTDTTDNCLGTFKFEGGGTISSMTITEYGTCDADGELENVELYEDDGDGNWESVQDTKIGGPTNFNSSDEATFSGFSLAASTYCYVHVILDVKSTADSGGTVGIELYQNDIVCTSTTTASSWPVQLETSIIGGETTPPSFNDSSFRSQNSTDVWITASQWNDDLIPNTKVEVQDTGTGLRIGSQEVSPDTHTVLLLHLNNDTTDYSGYGNNGTRYGGVDWISTDTWKTAVETEDILYFDGDDDYVDVTDPGTTGFDVTDEITISAWVRFNDIPSKAYEGIVTKDNAYILIMNSAGNGFVSYLYNGDSWIMSQDTGDLSMQPDVWYHVAMTFIDGSYLIYKDGQIASQDTDSLTIDTNNNPVLIGTDRLIANRNFNGMIDEVRILDRALTADEIAADYYSGLFKYSKDGGGTWYSISGSTVAWSTGTVTGVNGSTSYETIHASNVPFNQYSGTQNKIKFLVNDMQGNIAVSSEYIVMIGSITVSAYTDGDPDVPPSTVGKGTTENCLGTYKFDGTGTISQLTITEYGTCDAENELEYVKLFEDDSDGNWESGQDTTQLGSTTTFSGTSSTATFSGFSLAASTYCYVHVVLDVKSTAQVDNTIGIELYQNDIVCTSTTTAASWPVQLSSSTIKDLTPPAAITDLTGECDSDTGDVTLSWSTPGDDGWNNTLASGSKYIIDYSSYSIAWSTNTYDVEISTSGVAPHTEVSRTITGLQQDTTWYFQIWTADEIPNWSGLSNGATVWVTVIGTNTYTWTDGAEDGDWTNSNNWTGAAGYPSDADDKAVINTSTRTINTPASALTIGELELGGSYSGTLTLGNNLTLDDSGGWDGNLTIGAGTLDVSGSNHQINIDGNWSNSGTFTAQSGTVSFYATASKTLSGTMTGTSAFYNLYFDSASGTWTLNDNLKVTNVLNINAGELDASNKTIELAGSGTPFLVSGTFTPSASTVQYTSPSDTNITAANYYHLDLIDPPLETRNQKPVTSNQKELLQKLERLKIKEIEPDKFSFKSLSGDLIEIGEERHSPPQPYLKLNRWDGEVSLKVDIPYAIDGQKSLVDNRLSWVNHRYDVDFYPKFPQEIIETIQGEDHIFRINEEGGVEFDVTLKERPESNVFTFPIETQGLKFYYQPPLHPEHPTWADTDGDGKPDSFRPENVVGSYAVYHETQDKFFKTKEEAEKYKFGKAFHIYRPKIFDAEDNWVWGELNIKDNKLTVMIPQDFLDNAVYPVVIDPIFGYTTAGESNNAGQSNCFRGSVFTAPVDVSTATKITAWASNQISATSHFKGMIVLHSNLNIIADGVGGVATVNTDTTPVERDSVFSTAPSLTPNTEYVLGTICDTFMLRNHYDSGDTNQGHVCINNYTTPTDPTDASHNSNKYSIYCTYTAAEPGATYTLLSGTFDIDGNLTIGNSSDTMEVTADTNDSTIDLEGNFNITANSTFTASDTASFNVGGNWSNSGTFTHSTGTITLDGSSGTQTVTSGGQSFYNLVINNTGTSVQLEDDLDVNGNLTISTGTLDTKSGENNPIYVAGNWTREGGTFECRQSTVTFDNASSTSTLTGSTTFYVLVSTTTGKNVKVSSDTVIGVTNHLNFENITLRSTSNGATWYLNLSGSGTQDVSDVDVQDSNASGGDTIVAFGTNTDSGNNTNWDFAPPAAITDLTGLCDSDTGDVTLSWSTPGDDEWTGVLSSTSEYRIDYSTDSSRQWDKDTYEVSIPTYGVTPNTEVSHTITGLTGDSTWYFRIWTADEIPRWSGLSNGATVWVNPILSVSISTNTYDFGDVPMGQSTHTVSVITVTNEGNVNETYSLKISSVTLYDNSPSLWKSTNTTTGHNRFIFYAIFHAVQVSTSNFDSDDYVIDENRASTADWFSDNDGGGDKQTGINVPKGDDRKLWFRLDMPTSTTTGKEEKITVTITAGPE